MRKLYKSAQLCLGKDILIFAVWTHITNALVAVRLTTYVSAWLIIWEWGNWRARSLFWSRLDIMPRCKERKCTPGYSLTPWLAIKMWNIPSTVVCVFSIYSLCSYSLSFFPGYPPGWSSSFILCWISCHLLKTWWK